MELKINDFVNNIPPNYLLDIFKSYSCHRYDHLLIYPVENIQIYQMKVALKRYLELFTIENRKRDERKTKHAKIIETNNYKLLYETIYNDQFFEEPLMNIINQDKKYYYL